MRVKMHQCRNIIHPFPIFAWLIMIFQRMNPFNKQSWSHMAISIIDDSETFFDATGEGVREHTKENFLKQYDIIRSWEIKIDINRVQFYEFFDKHRGKEYDALQIWGLAFKMLGFTKKNVIGNDYDKMICSELIIAFLDHFTNLKVGDSDNYGLLNTWEIVRRH